MQPKQCNQSWLFAFPLVTSFLICFLWGTRAVALSKDATDDTCVFHAPPRVLHDMALQDVAVISVDPTERWILTKVWHANNYELIVRDRRSPKSFRTTSSSTQVELSWAPDGSAIAYMSRLSAKEPFSLFLWPLHEAQPRLLALPTSEEAIAPIKWARDGKAFLYASAAPHQTIVRLVTLQGSKALTTTVGESAGPHNYGWSGDGKSFYIVASDNKRLVRFDRAGHFLEETILRDIDKTDGVAVSESGSAVYVAAKKSSDRYMQILRLRNRGQLQQTCITYRGNLSLPTVLRNGSIVASLSSSDATTLVSAVCGSRVQMLGPQDGDVVLNSIGSDGNIIYASYASRTAPKVLLAINPVLKISRILYKIPNSASLSIPAPRHIKISSRDGDSIDVLVWRSPYAVQNQNHRVVVSSASWVGTGWTMVQQIVLAAGADYVVVKDRSNAEDGDVFESGFKPAGHVDDILRGMVYAIQNLHPLHGKVVLEGSSYGAYLATRAARMHPELVEALVIESMTGTDPVQEQFTRPAHPLVRLYQFHGDSDPGLTPRAAKLKLETILGTEVSRPPSGCFKTFINEEHTVHYSSNKAVMWGILASIVQHAPDAPVTVVADVQ